jgi:hypothetical protein
MGGRVGDNRRKSLEVPGNLEVVLTPSGSLGRELQSVPAHHYPAFRWVFSFRDCLWISSINAIATLVPYGFRLTEKRSESCVAWWPGIWQGGNGPGDRYRARCTLCWLDRRRNGIS